MSDHALRRLERQFQESGTEEDEVRYLMTARRKGQVTEELLQLCCWLGYRPAQDALGKGALPCQSVDWLSLCRLVSAARTELSERGMLPVVKTPGDWGVKVMARATIACARLILPEWEKERPGDRTPHEVLASAEQYLLCPCEEHDIPLGVMFGNTGKREAAYPLLVARLAARNACDPSPDDAGANLYSAVNKVGIHEGKLPRVNKALGEALVPWALGYGDPLEDPACIQRVSDKARWERPMPTDLTAARRSLGWTS